MANILIEDDHIKTVEKEMQEEREQLKSERLSFQERQDKLTLQQVRPFVCAIIMVMSTWTRARAKFTRAKASLKTLGVAYHSHLLFSCFIGA